ncbi:hypothetical protein O0I10_001360 [Lichtheimia ornata]|uniref:Brix domain-containing protein n=1 Tax=Lichtheimia ornata TaxID=688661 RepID=A0AAD8DIP7_9FUNG|nr:uncharacterized protein O0I10_001360 [Lichtheimia ornata]KAJ8663183.1 hypothetical protein O0I10_001360 [Lichtheimia ornata]
MGRSRGARRRKHRTHVVPKEEEINKIPKSFVMRSGLVGHSVSALVRDVRRIMEPHTATHLKERKTNRLKDFLVVAPQLGVTHFMIFTRTEANTNLRICRVPRGPTLTFRVDEYSLAKDCRALQKAPRTSDSDYLASPLLVLNNFKQEGKQFKLMAAMLQNMFPAIDVQTMKLSQTRRVLLFNYNEETGKIDMRHYSIGVKATGVSKSIKRIVEMSLPDMSKYDDISDYVMKEAIISESDVEDGPESTVTLAQNMHGRNNRKNEQRAVRLQEIGPRLTLDLIKIENGMCGGEVLYHKYVRKTEEQIKENEEKRQKAKEAAAERRKQQEANVALKKEQKEKVKSKDGEEDNESDADDGDVSEVGDEEDDDEEEDASEAEPMSEDDE